MAYLVYALQRVPQEVRLRQQLAPQGSPLQPLQ